MGGIYVSGWACDNKCGSRTGRRELLVCRLWGATWKALFASLCIASLCVASLCACSRGNQGLPKSALSAEEGELRPLALVLPEVQDRHLRQVPPAQGPPDPGSNIKQEVGDPSDTRSSAIARMA